MAPSVFSITVAIVSDILKILDFDLTWQAGNKNISEG